MTRGVAEEPIERRKCARGKHIRAQRRGVLDTGAHNLCTQAELADGRAEEGALAGVAFHQRDPRGRRALGLHDSDDQTGKAAAAAEVGPMPRRRRGAMHLNRVDDMAAPTVFERARGHEIDAAGPFFDERQKRRQPIPCFT